jgi:hypothetical protein
VLLFSACLPAFAGATAQRTFVSGGGVDNLSCSIGNPCRGFAAAITATNVGGEIVALDSAGYGSVIVTKSVSIIAPPGIYAGISVFAGFDGVTINAPGATVALRGLSINGQGGAKGINVQQAAAVRIENCAISGMGSSGIGHSAANGEVIVLDTIVRDNAGAGIMVVAANASILLDHVRSERNQSHGFSIAPTPGASGARATIADSVFAHNVGHGIVADTVGSAVTSAHVERTIISHNTGDGFQANAAAATGAVAQSTLMRNTIHGNGGDGILVRANPPGIARANLAENGALLNGTNSIHGDGNGARIRISANTGQEITCSNNAILVSLANNNVDSLLTSTCLILITNVGL